MKKNTPFRYDFVGSFLRPQELKDAKVKFEEGLISREELDTIADKAVTDIVKKQKEAGFHVITDGEFRRTFWHLDFMWGFEGVAHEKTGGGVQFNNELAVLDDTYLVGKVRAKAHPFVEYFKFLKQFEDENTVAKYTIPAPAQFYQQMIVPQNYETTKKYYANNILPSHRCINHHNSASLDSILKDMETSFVFSYFLSLSRHRSIDVPNEIPRRIFMGVSEFSFSSR